MGHRFWKYVSLCWLDLLIMANARSGRVSFQLNFLSRLYCYKNSLGFWDKLYRQVVVPKKAVI